MKLLATKSNEKNFFLRSQLYARAYMRIWTLRPCNAITTGGYSVFYLDFDDEPRRIHENDDR